MESCMFGSSSKDWNNWLKEINLNIFFATAKSSLELKNIKRSDFSKICSRNLSLKFNLDNVHRHAALRSSSDFKNERRTEKNQPRNHNFDAIWGENQDYKIFYRFLAWAAGQKFLQISKLRRTWSRILGNSLSCRAWNLPPSL